MNSGLESLPSVMASAPRLDGARCAGRAPEFDITDELLAADLIAECRRCPAYRPCSDFAASQGPNALNGVVAGRVFVWVDHESRRRPQGATA